MRMQINVRELLLGDLSVMTRDSMRLALITRTVLPMSLLVLLLGTTQSFSAGVIAFALVLSSLVLAAICFSAVQLVEKEREFDAVMRGAFFYELKKACDASSLSTLRVFSHAFGDSDADNSWITTAHSDANLFAIHELELDTTKTSSVDILLPEMLSGFSELLSDLISIATAVMFLMPTLLVMLAMIVDISCVFVQSAILMAGLVSSLLAWSFSVLDKEGIQ